MKRSEFSIEAQFRAEYPVALIARPIDWSRNPNFGRAIGVPPERIQRDLDERALVNGLKRLHTRTWWQVLWAQIRGEA